MGASLKIKLTQTSVNEAGRTADVNVEVTITSTAGTHNNFGSSTLGSGAVLYLTVDGATSSHYVSFGSSEAGTFTTNVYSGGFTVSYNANGTKSVYASARCITSTSAGTISSSASLSLTPIGSSGGSSGGDDSEEGDGDLPSSPSDENWYLSPGNSEVLSQTRNSIAITIGGSGYEEGNGHIGYTTNLTTGAPTYGITIIKFRTPEFTGTSTFADVNIQLSSKTTISSFNIALCSADDNRSNYIGGSSVVNDEYQISTDTMSLWASNTYGDVYEARIETTELKSNTDYYLILWLPSDCPSSDRKYVSLEENIKHAINVYNSEDDDPVISEKDAVCIDIDSAFVGCKIFIDNSTGWDCAILCIDNGTEFEQYE